MTFLASDKRLAPDVIPAETAEVEISQIHVQQFKQEDSQYCLSCPCAALNHDILIAVIQY